MGPYSPLDGTISEAGGRLALWPFWLALLPVGVTLPLRTRRGPG